MMDFKTVDAKSELVHALKTELPKFGFGSVKVFKSDPQTATDIPCIGINRVEDSEDSQVISDHAETRYDEASGKHVQVYGTFFSEALEVRVWHTNADERDKLYRHVKAILVALRPELVRQGLLNPTLRGGRDEQDSSMQQAPMVLYWAPITMSYLNPLDVEVTEIVPAITAIPTTQRLPWEQPSTIASNGTSADRHSGEA